MEFRVFFRQALVFLSVLAAGTMFVTGGCGIEGYDVMMDEKVREDKYKTCMKRAKQKCRDKADATAGDAADGPLSDAWDAIPPSAPTQAPSSGGGDWQSGTMTYYTGKEGGSRGAGGKILTPFKSVAIRIGDFKRMENRQVEIQGVGVVTVEDGCAGGACKDFDIYIGGDTSQAKRLPNWQAGNIPIKYRWL